MTEPTHGTIETEAHCHVVVSKLPTLDERFAGQDEHGSVEWSRDHLVRFHGWSEDDVESLNETRGDGVATCHFEEHLGPLAEEGGLPVPHTHVDPGDTEALRAVYRALQALEGEDAAETCLARGMATLGRITGLLPAPSPPRSPRWRPVPQSE